MAGMDGIGVTPVKNQDGEVVNHALYEVKGATVSFTFEKPLSWSIASAPVWI